MKIELNTEYIIIGEPTNLVPVIASKGIISFKIYFLGKGCHGSEPSKGINAIMLACKFINDVEKYFKTIEVYKNDIFAPNYATDGSFLNDLSSKTIILGPGPFNSHKPDEWVSKKSLYKTERVYKEIIENLTK